VARKGRLPGGNPGRLSLFHDVTVQYYRRREDDLALLTQVQLNGVLPRLSEPEVYPYAHLLAELVDRLTVGLHPGEGLYQYLASGLRGVDHHPDPERVALVYAWKLLQQAGLSPRSRSCLHCGRSDKLSYLDIAAGGFTCVDCAVGQPLPAGVAKELRGLLGGTVRTALKTPLTSTDHHWRALRRYLRHHVEDLRSLDNLPRTPGTPTGWGRV